MKKNMVYFILYIVLISELLMVIVERDELIAKEEEVRNKMLATIAEQYKEPLLLNVPEKTSDYSIKKDSPKIVVMNPIGLVSENEKSKVQYVVKISPKSKSRPSDFPSNGLSNTSKNDKYFVKVNPDGSAEFNGKFTSPGEYTFSAQFFVERELPDYLPEYLLNDLMKMVGENLNGKSKVVEFTVNAKNIGGLEKKEVQISW